uniref:Uncharacterized protein n=1 Tax=Helianthus annuus TaxID=4232 RepID=A0A251VN12_HELAN
MVVRLLDLLIFLSHIIIVVINIIIVICTTYFATHESIVKERKTKFAGAEVDLERKPGSFRRKPTFLLVFLNQQNPKSIFIVIPIFVTETLLHSSGNQLEESEGLH